MLRGSCHCGSVKFEIEAELSGVVSCNCSICNRVGALRFFVPAGQFRLLSGDETLVDYQFGRRHIHHRFCRDCGVHPFADGKNPKDGKDVVSVNARCLEGVDVSRLPVRHFDGAGL